MGGGEVAVYSRCLTRKFLNDWNMMQHFGLRRTVRSARLAARSADDRSPAMATAAIETRDALKALTYRKRAVLVLRYYADLSDVEIAAVLSCRPATVRSLAHRALGELRGQLS